MPRAGPRSPSRFQQTATSARWIELFGFVAEFVKSTSNTLRSMVTCPSCGEEARAAGLVYGKLGGWPFEQAVRFASAVGALATTAVGASEGVRGLEETLALAGLE